NIIDADYFYENSNKKLKIDFSEKKGKTTRKIISEPLENENWGTFSLEGGAKSKIDNLLLTLEMNEGHLKEDYKPNHKIYEEFLELYKQLKEQRNQDQSYNKMIQKYKNITNMYNEKSLELEQFKERNKEKLKSLDNKITESINLLNQQNAKIKEDQLSISNKLERLTNDKEQAERNYSTIKEQKPSMMFFQKIFNPNNAKDYLDKLAHANEELNEINNLKNELMKNEEILSNEL